jgi:hypothetical protein
VGANVSDIIKINNFRANTVYRSDIPNIVNHSNNEISCEVVSNNITKLQYPFKEIISGSFRELIDLMSRGEFTIEELTSVYQKIDTDEFNGAMANINELIGAVYLHVADVMTAEKAKEEPEETESEEGVYYNENTEELIEESDDIGA